MRGRDFDRSIILVVFAICAIGIITIYSATQAKGLPITESFALRQINWLIAGLVMMLVCIRIPYQRFLDVAYALFAVNLIMLVVVLIIGQARLGAQRWISIGSFAFQPSEFIKINLILVLTGYVASKKGNMRDFGNLIVPMILLFLPFALVLAQPDLGTGLLLVPVFLAILYIGGAKARYLLGFIGIGLAAMPFFWHFLRDYQKQRLMVFLDPSKDPLGAGYTIIQSKIAVGSGGIIGKGWLAGTQNQLNFLPERHTDFIFSVIGEEWGFFGSAILVLLYLLLVRKALRIASATSDMYGKLIATGIATLFALQVVINIGMTIGLMPVVGIPLPFVSYGGSSLIANLIAIGLLLNVGMRRSTF